MEEKFIESLCTELENNIYNCTSIPSVYKEKILPVPNLIKRQALEVNKELEERTELLFFLVGKWTNELLDYMKEVDKVYNELSSEEKYYLSSLRLAPFQLSLYASRISSVPGIIKKYEGFKNEKLQS